MGADIVAGATSCAKVSHCCAPCKAMAGYDFATMPLSDHPATPAAQRYPASVPLLLAALVFLVSLIVTYVVADKVERTAENELQATFDYRVRDLAAILARRM